MNYINCIARLFEIPNIKLSQNEIPLVRFKIEIIQSRNSTIPIILEAIVWGDLAYDVINKYSINDYILIEGYLKVKKLTSIYSIVKLKIFQIKPFFITTSLKNSHKLIN